MLDLNQYSERCMQLRKCKGFTTGWNNIVEKLMLVVTELAEATEALRVFNRDGFKEEIADTFIRLFDICGSLDIDIEYEIEKKISINITRPHKHGKRF